MIFDIYIPSFKLALEYYGYQHYYNHLMFGDVESRKERDLERHKACNSIGITFIEVPYWWQRDEDSIISILYKSRPDLVTGYKFIPFSYGPKMQKQSHHLYKIKWLSSM